MRKKNIARQRYICFKTSFSSTIFVLQAIGLIKQAIYKEEMLDKKNPNTDSSDCVPLRQIS